MSGHIAPPDPTSSTPVVVAALVAFGAFGTAAVLFIAGDAATERLGLLFAMFGVIVAGLIAALRADHAASQTNRTSEIATSLNGDLDGRIRKNIETALAERAAAAPHDRATDPPA